MSFIRTSIKLSSSLLTLFPLVVFPANGSKQKHKVHDYSQLVGGRDYVFELLNGGMEAQMTGVGKGIKPDDYIILQHGSGSYRYRVEDIDYYSDPPNMWMALLKQI
jgi:hypothetical protein